MSLSAGTRLGPYEILSALGAGGMGEVYKARDTKLGRDVAIKILRRGFTSDPERLARFEREARMLASLNHPHIGAIYGVEEADGVRGLVLELVEGQTLAERIQHGALPVAEALAVARQIADALDAAHEKGIVHRDLKPANIKITPDGAVKVLDFGLAKAAVGDASTPDLSQSPTVTIGGTREGVILGTAAYMSPEQARGQVVDKRTDIWAFGCVLYEMLTGRAAFACNTITDTLAAIVQHEPDWTALRSATPPTIKRLLQRSLEKDAGRRLRDIADARVEIDEALARTRPHATDRRPWSRRVLPWALGLLAASAAAASTVFFLRSRLASPASSLEMHQVTAFTDFATQPSLSADGRMLAFIRGPGSRLTTAGQVYVKLLPDGEPVQLTHDPMSKMMPVFSPDGSRIAYGVLTANGSWDTWIVPVLGGEARLWLPKRQRPSMDGIPAPSVLRNQRWRHAYGPRHGDREPDRIQGHLRP
jgi:serine/threonine protein kinase